MSVELRWTGGVATLSDNDRRGLFDRGTTAEGGVRDIVASIIAKVRSSGDDALRVLASEFDGVVFADSFEVPRAECSAALESLSTDVRRAMERSLRNIRAVHAAFLPCVTEIESEPGVLVGRRPDPLQRVGVYAPGGRAPYPSSVLMGVAPARVAGVSEIVVCSPPRRSTGLPSSVVLAAAALAGADRVFALGGAGAIAAMAYGTQSVPRVDRIVGPGNAYVAEAKLQVASVVGIDSPAGPSELLVLADRDAEATTIAREMLAQAEHDPVAAVVAVVVGPALADSVRASLNTMIESQPRADIALAALRGQGAVLFVDSLDDAIAFSNAYAPEHLLLLADGILDRLRNAGTIFVGAYASVAYGDYMTGANHVLPTGGLARAYSGLSTLDFMRWTTYQRITRDGAARLADDVSVFADAEGLGGHALAARAWRVDT